LRWPYHRCGGDDTADFPQWRLQPPLVVPVPDKRIEQIETWLFAATLTNARARDEVVESIERWTNVAPHRWHSIQVRGKNRRATVNRPFGIRARLRNLGVK
jgi:hypothetical protein